MAKKHVIETKAGNRHPEWARKTAETNAFLNAKEKKGIVINDAVIKTNIVTAKMNRPSVKNDPNFDWSLYEDGWNGRGLRVNPKVKAKGKDKVFSHEAYASELYKKYSGLNVVGSKELVKNALVSISDISPLDNDNVILTINGGANNVIVDLNKEQKFLNQFSVNNEKITKDEFIKTLSNDTFKKQILNMNLFAKITPGDVEKASIWDGYVEALVLEMKEQITKKSKAYYATILSTNKGGFVVDIMNTIKAFMPGSMAAANRVTDFESFVGKKFEVMVESYDPSYGFVVSRKKFLRTMLPSKLNELNNKLIDNKDTVFTGHVTGTTLFGVFVELDEFITGMLHKTLVRDETREAMRNNAILPGTEIKVYVHKIENNRVILSDVPSSERDVVIARREAEEILEKQEAENVVEVPVTEASE